MSPAGAPGPQPARGRLLPTRIPATLASRLSTWLLGWWGVTQGVGLLLTGPERWASPGLTFARAVPGSLYTWGAVILAAGLLTLLASWRFAWAAKAIGLLVLSVWAGAFALAGIAALLVAPGAATTGPPSYLLISCWAAVLVRIDEGNWRR